MYRRALTITAVAFSVLLGTGIASAVVGPASPSSLGPDDPTTTVAAPALSPIPI